MTQILRFRSKDGLFRVNVDENDKFEVALHRVSSGEKHENCKDDRNNQLLTGESSLRIR